MFDPERIFYSIPAIILGFTIHEFAHAFTAFKLGDNTARDQGRLTLNPIKHIDVLGFLFVIFAGFGWAKPVQFSPSHLRHPRRDRGLIALAGPVSNAILGLLFTLICRLMRDFSPVQYGDFYLKLYMLCIYAAYTNFGLFIFNMLPIPPLDGSHIFFSGLNISRETEMNISRIGMPLLFIILIIESRTDFTILPISKMVNDLMSLFLG